MNTRRFISQEKKTNWSTNVRANNEFWLLENKSKNSTNENEREEGNRKIPK